MYNSQIMVKRIRSIAKEKGIGIVKLHEICGMSRNAISQAEKSPGGMTTKNIYSIAEALDCSVDYLLGRTDTPKPEAEIIKDNHDNHVFGVNAVELPVTIVSPETHLDENQQELLKRFSQLKYTDKLAFMQQLVEKTEEE